MMIERLPSAQLAAFEAVAETGGFSRAAARLRLTQPALSQRVLNLEAALGGTLFVRAPGPGGAVRLTALGEELRGLCAATGALEGEFLRARSGAGAGALAGDLRVAGFSTVVRPIALPALVPLAAENPGVRLQLLTLELRELPSRLRSGEADLVLGAAPIDRAGVVDVRLGQEEYVLARAARGKPPRRLFLDHDPEDETTFAFLRRLERRLDSAEGAEPRARADRGVQRAFLDDIHGILDAVALGLGYAVVPLHLVARRPDLKVLRQHGVMRSPVYLSYARMPTMPRLRQEAIARLRAAFAAGLSPAQSK